VDVESGTVIHAYGIVRNVSSFDLPDIGVGSAGVALLDAGPISGVFSILPEETYGEAAWQEHGDDPEWLAQVATEHERVLDALVKDTDVLPLRLPAMYRDEAHLHDVLAHQATLFEAVLDALHDHLEWSVHLYHVGRAEPPDTERASNGRDYLRRKSQALADRDVDRKEREQLVRDAYATLADASRSSVVNRPQDSVLNGRREPMLLNSAHLVNRRHERFFIAAVEEAAGRLAASGITIEVTGPWPPYNFIDLGTDVVGASS
jgi:hypothetical protein